jgi:glycosyltransferase involved in cell wall biosynthesis
VAICVPTYQRPVGLERLLRALGAQEFAGDGPCLSVVVVDNDPEGSAREVCEQAAEWIDDPLRYVIEKRRGIPRVRNAGLEIAMGFADFVAFKDDDMEHTPRWIAELMRVQTRFQADVVAGPCVPRFLEPPPAWVVEGGFHERPRHRSGTPVDRAATGNALIRCRTLHAMERLFDESLRLQGAEDTEFFRRVSRAGHRMVWADEALVYECLPPARASLRWLMQRHYRIANAHAGVELRRLEDRTRTRALLAGFRCLARGGLQLGRALAIGRGPVERARALLLLASGAGWLSGATGFRYQAYRSVDGR